MSSPLCANKIDQALFLKGQVLSLIVEELPFNARHQIDIPESTLNFS
jgi:hypothetical protein